MKVIISTGGLPTNDSKAFREEDWEKPKPTGHDVLVQVKAISVNPADPKIQNGQMRSGKDYVGGWDATGIIEAVGAKVKTLAVGERVYYAGDITRSGSNAEYQLVDEFIVGRAPNTLNDHQAASLPLTSITAYEGLYHKANLSRGERVLLIGGAGGVGSMAIQIAKQFIGAEVYATASRAETKEWCEKLGANVVLNHRKGLVEEAKRILGDRSGEGGYFDVIYSTTNTADYWDIIPDLLKPFGRLVMIDDPQENLGINSFKTKSLSIHWELMFTRPMFSTSNRVRQQDLLNEVSRAVDAGTILHTEVENFQGLSVDTLRKAHQQVASQTTIGKLTITL